MRAAFVSVLLLAFVLSALPAPASASDAMDFDSGVLHNGSSFSQTFNETGTFPYHCHIHMSMMGNVTVVDTAGAPTSANVTIQNSTFTPENVTIAMGGTVTWTNLDHAPHQVVSGAADAMMMDGHDGGMMMSHHAPRAVGLAENDTFRHLPPDVAARGLDRANASKLFAKLTYANGMASGRFVSFNWSDATGTIMDYRHNVWNETIFSNVTIEGWASTGSSGAHGAVFHARGTDQFVSVHNNPTVGLHIQTDETETNVTFDLAPTEQINVNSTTSKAIVVTDAAGKYHGHIVLLGNATATNTTGLGGSVRVHLGADDGVLFLAHPGGDTAAAGGLHATIAAAAGGHLGTVLDLADENGTPVEDELPLTAHAHATSVAHGKVVLLVQSDTSDGKTIVVRVPTETLGGGAVNVTVGSETFAAVNVTGADAKAALATLQAAGKGAIVNFAANGTEVTILVPHFSDQTVTIQQAEGTSTPPPSSSPAAMDKGAPGFEAPLALAALALLTLAVRRRGGA
jgi:plastocyanin